MKADEFDNRFDRGEDVTSALALASARRLGAVIELTHRPDPEALLSTLQARKQRTGSRLSAETILAHRDMDRR